LIYDLIVRAVTCLIVCAAKGATATMEAWSREEKPNLTFSHPWCAGANSVIVRLLLGVQPLALGWTRWQFAPQPSSLGFIRANVPSLHGTINITIANGGGLTTPKAAAVEADTQVFSATFTVPEGTTARVCLPPAHGVAAVSALELDLNGVKASSVVEGRMLCLETDVKPGTHTARRLVHGA
jgi:hypothetical protein